MWKVGLSFALLLLAVPAQGSDADGGSSEPSPIPTDARQLVVVQSPSWSAVTATLQRFERPHGDSWDAQGAPVPVNVGRNGMAWGRGLHSPGAGAGPTKKEGDQRSPAGAFLLGSAFGYGEGLPEGAKGYPFLHLRQGISCIEDSHSKFYNQVIDPLTVTNADWSVKDEMLRADGLFRWGIVVEHNAPDALRGAGSCIFLHIWRGAGKGTAGCTAMAPEVIEEIIGWLNASERPVLVQLPLTEYTRLRSDWALP